MSTIGYANKFWGIDFTSTAGFDNLVRRMDDGKSTCKSLEHFLRLRSRCEEDYAKGLLKISKAMAEFNEAGTLNDAWGCMRVEMERVAKEHSEASHLLTAAATNLSDFQKQQRNARKPKEDAVSSLAKEKNSCFKKTMEARRLYEQRSGEAVVAEGALKKAKVNENSYPTKEWDKIVSRSTKALQECTKSEMSYKELVDKVNEVRVDWQRELTSYAQLCETQDMERMSFVRDKLWEASNITSVNCLEDDKAVEVVRGSLERVRVDNDMALFVARNQTGTEKPEPLRFEMYQGSNDTPHRLYHHSSLSRLKDLPSGGKSILTIKRM